MSSKHDLNQPFDSAAIEKGLYEGWEVSGHFRPSGKGTPYSIAIPPPNVTGTLHLGHAFQSTLMDILTRYHRMSGHNALWQVGTDHAGISTQMVVTESLLAQGISPDEIGREEFVKKAWEWREKFGGTITHQLRKLGASVDWERERFTLDEGFSRAVIEVFVRLYDEGLIYKAQRLVNWDPQLETAVSDLEVNTEEQDGHLWHIRYPLGDGKKSNAGDDYVVVATTRPETMLGDTGVAVNPTDERYRHLIGGFVVLPLVGRKIPIVADEHVDVEFGTGCLKITPAHDFDDYEIGERHNLEVINIFTTKAALNDQVPEKYQGLDRFEARELVLKDLEELELLHAIEDHRNQVPTGERSGAVVEPRLTYQWWVKIKPLAEPAIDAVKQGKIRFHPKEWENVYFAWMNDIRDWSISRQLWWGHRIPAWYTDDGKIVVGRTEAEARSKNGLGSDVKLSRDPDVLDTWFSSALWTFGTLGWPEKTRDLDTFHPTDVLVTGHDIIFFWVARMIMMTLHLTDEIPFENVYITGLIRDASGQKMSKTKANGLDPLDVIEGISLQDLIDKRTQNLTQPRMAERIKKETRRDFPDGIPGFGTDALRMTFSAMASPTRNYNFDLKQVEAYNNFCNKLWNATRYVVSQLEGLEGITDVAPATPADHWMRTKLIQLMESTQTALATYRFDLYAKAIYSTVWHEFCDWYLEFSKIVLYDTDASESEKLQTKATLAVVLDALLRLTHPVMPYITEALWTKLKVHLNVSSESLLTTKYPEITELPTNGTPYEDVEWIKGFITGVRAIRGERNIPPSRQIPVYTVGPISKLTSGERWNVEYVSKLARIDKIIQIADSDEIPLGSMNVYNGTKIVVPFLDQDEIDKEKNRLNKEIGRLQKTIKQSGSKLENPNFVEKAPADVVEKEKKKLSDSTEELSSLERQVELLANLD